MGSMFDPSDEHPFTPRRSPCHVRRISPGEHRSDPLASLRQRNHHLDVMSRVIWVDSGVVQVEPLRHQFWLRVPGRARDKA